MVDGLVHLEPTPGSMLEGEHEVFGSEHPIRQVTRDIAFGGEWTSEMAQRIAAMFDDLATRWNDMQGDNEHHTLDDALDRGAVGDGRCLELGSGTGLGTARLAPRFESVVALDVSAGMLRNAPPELGLRVQGDSSALPVRSASIDVLVLVNMFLFPGEVDRVLSAHGTLVWVNSYAEETPIHLPADEVVTALPGTWTGNASRSGSGTWCVLRRA